jgi:ATP-dependent exoDNAse (exonuclease V) beta subunit
MANVIPFPGTAIPAVVAPSDADAREQALEIRSSCIVEAPAGSGKTGLLVQRYLKLLADEHVNAPEEVLAVTFTRKATAELRERVLAELLAAQRNVPLPPDAQPFQRSSREVALAALARSRQLDWQLLEQPLRLNIHTFDAVAMQIANALPLLSGSGGPREPLENAAALHRLAARYTLLQLGGKDRTLHESLHTVLLHRDGNLAECEQLIAQMLEKREQWGELVPLDRNLDHDTLDNIVRPRLEHGLEAIVIAGLQRALDAIPAGKLAELCEHALRLSSEPGYNGQVSPIALCAEKASPPEAHPDHVEHWLALICLLFTNDCEWRSSFNVNHVGITLSKADKETLRQFVLGIKSERLRAALEDVRNLPPSRYPDEQWALAKALFFVLRHALAELKVLFAERGECDFTELALAAREALGHADEDAETASADLALTGGGRLRHLLIDEMQDTSAAQYELIHRLTRSWDGATQTLFLVGDPKQSIYLFRAASVERFLRTMAEARLGEIRLTPLRLTANFRSQAALVAGFNHSFEPLFLRPGEAATEAVEVPFVAATASREETQPDGIRWHVSELDPDALPPGVTHADREARQLCGFIRQRLDMDLPAGRSKPWSIAVLGHGRNHLAAVVKELRRAQLAYKAIDIDPLAGRPEVLDALALTRALLHPADRIAWLAVLHAPWCGLGVADLLALTGDGTDAITTVATLVANHRSLLSAEGKKLLDRAWPVLASAVATLGRTPLSVQVERTWRSLGGDAPLTPEERNNVLRYLAVLREVEAEDARVDLDVLQARLGGLYAEPLAGDAQIELLTIHKAKGLEWDLVLVPGLERASGRSNPPLLNWLEFDPASPEDAAAVILAPIGSKGSKPGTLGRWLTRLRSQRELAERKRLFYVAATRAREELHLFAAAKRKGDDSFVTPHHSSLLRACWLAAEEHFAGLRQPVQETPETTAYAGDDEYDEPLALAASALDTEAAPAIAAPPMLQRLPASFDPGQRFTEAAAHKLAYTLASALPRRPAFARPEGSFAVRAFGNVVHRYLQLLAERLVSAPPAGLIAELPGWQPRLETSLRGEGLPPSVAAREATRALRALTLTLNDPTGLWLLSPHAEAASEGALTTAAPGATGLRVDRTFIAGPEPLSTGQSCIWIVDFKTSEQGSRSDAAFAAAERAKYSAQLETYAALRRSLPGGDLPIRLGLFYPLGPVLLQWESVLGTGG